MEGAIGGKKQSRYFEFSFQATLSASPIIPTNSGPMAKVQNTKCREPNSWNLRYWFQEGKASSEKLTNLISGSPSYSDQTGNAIVLACTTLVLRTSGVDIDSAIVRVKWAKPTLWNNSIRRRKRGTLQSSNWAQPYKRDKWRWATLWVADLPEARLPSLWKEARCALINPVGWQSYMLNCKVECWILNLNFGGDITRHINHKFKKSQSPNLLKANV